MGSSTTTARQLDRAGGALLGNSFLGAYPSGHPAVRSMEPGQCLIVNTDETGQPGQHWLALAHDLKRGVIAYDSFGRQVAPWALASDPDPEQRLLEQNCGQRCLAWLICWKKLGAAAALAV